MLSLETSIQQWVKVEVESFRINDLVSGLPDVGRALARSIGSQLLDRVQELLYERLQTHRAEIVCERCGVVHRAGEGTLLRRGSRLRRLKTSIGVLRFGLRQLTCRDCRRTWSPFARRRRFSIRTKVVRMW